MNNNIKDTLKHFKRKKKICLAISFRQTCIRKNVYNKDAKECIKNYLK